MVSTSRIKILTRLLIGTQWMLGCIVALAIFRLVIPSTVPANPSEIQTLSSAITNPTDTDSYRELKPLSSYSPLWNRNLRQSPLPPTIAETTTKQNQLQLQQLLPVLMGTFVEGTGGWAHLASPRNRLIVAKQNDVVDGYELVSIEPGKVQLQYGTDSFWLEIKQPESLIQQLP